MQSLVNMKMEDSCTMPATHRMGKISEGTLFYAFVFLCLFYAGYFYLVGIENGELQGSHLFSYIKEAFLWLLLAVAYVQTEDKRRLFVRHRCLLISLCLLVGVAVVKSLLATDLSFLLSIKTLLLMAGFFILFYDTKIPLSSLSKAFYVVLLVQIPIVSINAQSNQWGEQAFGTLANPTALAFFICFCSFLLFQEKSVYRCLVLFCPWMIYLTDSFAGLIVLVAQMGVALALSLLSGKQRGNALLLILGFVIASLFMPLRFERLYIFCVDMVMNLYSALPFTGAEAGSNRLDTLSISVRAEQAEALYSSFQPGFVLWGAPAFKPFDSALVSFLWNFGLLVFLPMLVPVIRGGADWLRSLAVRPYYLVGLLPIFLFLSVIRIHIFHSFWICIIVLLLMMRRDREVNREVTNP